jgi:hypothetical protein
MTVESAARIAESSSVSLLGKIKVIRRIMIANKVRIRKTAIIAEMQIDSNPYDSIECFRIPYEIREIVLFSGI